FTPAATPGVSTLSLHDALPISAGAGFMALNVLNESQSRPLTEKLGVLEDPMVLVYRRPGDLVVQFSGYADQQTIAQAARNAALRSEEHTSELQSRGHLVCRLLP